MDNTRHKATVGTLSTLTEAPVALDHEKAPVWLTETTQQALLPKVSKTSRIAVLCGGRSSEREVSLRSGKNCVQALQALGYTQAKLVEVDAYIAHYLIDERIELVFLAMHGETGEDGAIQGLLEVLGIPYTGNRIQACAITMDKARTKQLLASCGLPVLPSHTFWWNAEEGGDLALLDELMQTLGFPMMVKPIATGSSVGMSKVDSTEQLVHALEVASTHQAPVLVEPFTQGRDLTIGVVQVDGRLKVTPILEIKPKTGWYDYDAKYTPGQTDFLLPAPLSQTDTLAIQQIALQAHQAVGCHGVSRIDFIMTPEGFYILEVNATPGMTDLSDLPAQCNAMGLGFNELVEAILQTAVQPPVVVAGLTPHPVDLLAGLPIAQPALL
jgi:D-alanine-D-alanine ligase